MAEQSSGAPSRAPIAAGLVGVAALIASAVVSVEPENKAAEGEKLVGYLDQGHIATICRGHTGPEVRVGMKATPAQCSAWYRQDMTAKMKAVIRITPRIAENVNALKASGDFAFNAGEGWYAKSPMAAHFAKGEWAAGCNAFPGFITLYRAPKAVPGQNCRTVKGVLYCEARGLVARRLKEQAICLGKAA